jgi:hypothetical protein
MKIIFLIIFCFPLYALAQLTGKPLSAEEIVKLIPRKIHEFYPSSDSKGRVVKLGTLQYSMAERNFAANRKRSIKILLFDYKEAPVMYNQATRKWSTFRTIESDSLIQRLTIVDNCPAWESYDAKRKNSQILVGIFSRYFLTVEGTNVDLEALKKAVSEFRFDTFPK